MTPEHSGFCARAFVAGGFTVLPYKASESAAAFAQIAGNRRDRRLPIRRCRLRVDAQAGIPRTVISAREPAPAAIKTVQQPDRFAQSAGEVRHRGIDGDHPIEICDQRRGIGEIRHLRH